MRHGLDLVVGDVDHRRAQLLVQPRQLDAHVHAQRGVQVGQRLVEQEDLGLAHDGAADGHALALAARQFLRVAAQQLGDAQDLGRAADLRVALGLAARRPSSARSPCSRPPSCAGTARSSGTPWPRRGRPGAASLARWPSISSSPPLMLSSPAIMRSVVRLAAARGPDEDQELAVVHVQVDALDDVDRAVALADAAQADTGPSQTPVPPWPARWRLARWARRKSRYQQRAVLQRALLRGVVDVHDAEALGVARGPLEVVQQAPHHVAGHAARPARSASPTAAMWPAM